MDQKWYQKFFAGAVDAKTESTLAKAEGGDADAQFRLGLDCATAGPEQDYPRAAEWYLKAAHQQHCLAQFNLGVMFALGQGVTRDESKSAFWTRKAADLGDAGAQFALGMKRIRETFGPITPEVVESRIEAYKWLNLAAAQGYRDSDRACESLMLQMSREAVTEGDGRVARFKAQSAKATTKADLNDTIQAIQT